MKSSAIFKVIGHLIEGIIGKKNCSFLICQNGRVIRNNYKRKSKQVITDRGSTKQMHQQMKFILKIY